ncbi:MAG: hypothetical protein H0X33_05640 [Taibaiella sp.]|nr:hypothetical protein [Taibaiella sp.]
MAIPIGLFFTWAGYRIGLLISKSTAKSQLNNLHGIIILIFILSTPLFMSFESLIKHSQPIRSIVTSIEINAPIEKVWRNVIAFPELKAPSEFIFRAGIAFPINATISAKGAGAIRRCNFSTGSFVEPITVWDEPNLLRFSVREQPDVMRELSPYNIHPNHLKGYWVSKQGQFKLRQLSDGRTLLEGTTWYVNKIAPDLYWHIWSDYIVHKIHMRVLTHIKKQSESS